MVRPRIVIVGAGSTGAHLARRLASSWEIVLVDPDAGALEAAAPGGSRAVAGDGSSRLVLREAGVEGAHAIVACTGSDEVNLEALRIAGELGIESRHALMRSEATEPEYRAAGIDIVNLRDSCSVLLESRIERHKVATAIGLGEGEIMEVSVTPGSSVVGTRLRDLHPRKWLVGAIYREGKLIVPHGDTVIEGDDRVLLIGDPRILPAIATHLRTGEPEFPLHYGTNIVVIAKRAPPPLCEEVHYLLRSSAAEGAILLGGPEIPDAVGLAERCDRAAKPLEVVVIGEASELRLAAEAATRDAGLIVLPPARLSWLSQIGLTRSILARLADRAQVPILVARGSVPYLKVMLVLAEAPFDPRAAQLALDLTRTVGGQLILGVVHHAELVVGARMRKELEEEQRQIEALARLYHVDLVVEVLEGNPVRQAVQRSRELSALVLAYPRRRPSLMRPDVAQNIALLAHCSSFLMPG